MADKFQLKALITGVDKLSPTLDGIRKNVAKLRKNLRQSGMAEIDFGHVAAITAPLVGAAKAAIDFESAMADVRKVVDFDTPQQFADMNTEIRQMALQLPMAAKEIAAIYAQGGSAGIARGELKGFAQDAVKMGVAFGFTAEQSGEQMAAWRAAMGLTQDGVRALADQINYLDAKGNSSAKNVAEVVTRVGSIGKVAGLSASTIAALSATMDAVKVPTDVAATGIKNFVLALTQGTAASKSQKETLKALRLDAGKVAKSMQMDSKGTVLDVLNRIKAVDPAKQAAVLSELFGKESIEAIAPFISNLDLLKTNLKLVGDATGYAGSMSKEFEVRAATTANGLQLFWNRVTDVGIAVGNVLLPPLNEFMALAGPMVTSLSNMAAANPWLIKGLLGAGAAMLGMRLALMATVGALNLFNAVASLSPVGIAVRVMALAAGFLLSNWGQVGPFFSRLWDGIKRVVSTGVDFIKTYLGWTPLGVVLNNWEPIKAFFGALWGGLKVVFDAGWQFIKWGFENFTPLGLIIKNWEPIVAFFKGMWERVKPYIEPMISAAKWAGDAVSGVVGQSLNAGTSIIKGATQQAKAELTVNLNGAPAGTRVEQPATTNTKLTVNQNTGRRALASPTS
ncbi:phage tail tape measure protein [Pseudogulbenkiania ferrooxidans]|uniref:Phage tail tape measure protein, TP901 family n=1 Tax=Pseudogulbenkiania ferrooxidans 2002 TaxID=279714 RepID=B9YYV2_9NEIS|nr:phage tail tape measure protein [Pseudogulbenkiania ferrooxidans]EEG10305.1 phage tail tape measure protein, TP901 family [Pseudogulbenkiania ferrooxidans 2002]